MTLSPLAAVGQAQTRGRAQGITSICSANPLVLEASFSHAREHDLPLLVESTCNQVNQYGGYTGQTPAAFMQELRRMAAAQDLPPDQLIAGGDHLGPYPWKNEPAPEAMQKAAVMVRDYVAAGYTKIHLDASMRCAGDDPRRPLPVETIAARAADLALVAETTSREMGGVAAELRYVIGTEVPVPGGALDAEEELAVTAPADVAVTIETTRAAFVRRGLAEAWERVIAVVVQPGVEYGDTTLFDYDPLAARDLSRYIESQGSLVYEAHSTDYQTPAALAALVADHFAILKVGPALTFAMREALFSLAQIEAEMLPMRPDWRPSRLRETLEAAMLADPGYWTGYYAGTDAEQRFARRYSYSDRSRYYWPVPAVQDALATLMANLSAGPIPNPLLSQFLPAQYRAVREGRLPGDPCSLIRDAITAVLDVYAAACGQM